MDSLNTIQHLQRRLRDLESELIGSYFSSRTRSDATDRDWLARQCHKEYWGGYRRAREALSTALAKGEPDTRIATLMRLGAEEFCHYRVFAHAYGELGDGTPPPLGDQCADLDWPENRYLNELRAEQEKHFSTLGSRARALSEGGGGALYDLGAALRSGGSRADRLIAAACERVVDDEQRHRRAGMADLGDEPTARQVLELFAAQIGPRLLMRNAQFGNPWPVAQVAARARHLTVPLHQPA